MKQKTMTLKDYLYFNGITRKAFATRVGMNHSHISRIANLRMVPVFKTAMAIERETAGVVNAIELMRLCFEAKLERENTNLYQGKQQGLTPRQFESSLKQAFYEACSRA